MVDDQRVRGPATGNVSGAQGRADEDHGAGPVKARLAARAVASTLKAVFATLTTPSEPTGAARFLLAVVLLVLGVQFLMEGW